jgi:uncharacterized protein (DUF885 family)
LARPRQSAVYDISDRYVDQYAEADPCGATFLGIAGHDHEMTDYSPGGMAERVQLARDTIAALDAAPQDEDADRVAAAVMRDSLQRDIDFFDTQEDFRPLRIIGSPVQAVRQCFDLMSYESDDDWATVTERMTRVPQALSSIEETLREGVARGVVAARRQALACAEQAEAWGGDAPYFRTLASRRADDTALTDAAEIATLAYADFGAYLRDEYAPKAEPRDPVGRDRYKLFAAAFNGVDLDLDETYAWGVEEMHRIEHQMQLVGERILPAEPVGAVIEHLDHDPTRSIEGVDNFQRWNQELIDRTISEMNGVHFDIAEPLQRCEAMIAPPGGAAAMYYTGPAEDFSRPGRTWYPTLGKTRFPLWDEVTTCYHEGVPGHHLQIAQVRYLAGTLSRYQRTLAGTSGHAEGWALYAERLMGELGYLDEPDYEMGMLAAQAMRAMRVIVDIGLHLELPIPADEPYHGGERWTPELALPFAIEHSRKGEDFIRSEVDRYLGWPGQAISYKVGERVWLDARDDARRRAGDRFDQKEFHRTALDLGPMGLAQLQTELARV